MIYSCYLYKIDVYKILLQEIARIWESEIERKLSKMHD